MKLTTNFTKSTPNSSKLKKKILIKQIIFSLCNEHYRMSYLVAKYSFNGKKKDEIEKSRNKMDMKKMLCRQWYPFVEASITLKKS